MAKARNCARRPLLTGCDAAGHLAAGPGRAFTNIASPPSALSQENRFIDGAASSPGVNPPRPDGAGCYADLLVVGSRGSGGLGQLGVGSVSSQVACDAPCPVVIIFQP